VEEAVKKRAGERRPSATAVPPPRPAAIIELEDRLGERLGTAVKIDHGKRGGKVSIRYASLDDLERIYHLLN
jgi:ParB family chromosome partitioning protein